MIVESVIKEMATRLSEIGFLSLCGGILQEVSVTAAGVSVRRPVAQIAPFTDGKQHDLSPDKKQSGIAWFRVGATRVSRQDMYISQYENEVQLTVWLNTVNMKAGIDTSPEHVIVNALRRMRIEKKAGNPIRTIDIDYLGDSPPDISRYGWDAPEFQYNSAPYRFFQANFKLSYIVATGCFTQSVAIVNPAC